MNDNVIAYILSLVCIIFILIEIVSVNKKKGMTDLIVFFYYSCPLYYFMLYEGTEKVKSTFRLKVKFSKSWFYPSFSVKYSLIKAIYRKRSYKS